MTRHVLKLWTDQFDAMKSGAKRADVRRCDDRNFIRGDEVLYRDYTAGADKYSGRALLGRITHLTRGAGLFQIFGRVYSQEGPLVPIVVLSIELLEVGDFERLNGTALVAPPAPPAAPVTATRYFTCKCGGPKHGKTTGCSGTGCDATGGLCAWCVAECRPSAPKASRKEVRRG